MQIGAVIVAAGMSSRMGDFKPMLNIGSISIAQRIIATLHQADIAKIVVITGFNATMLERHLAHDSVIFLRNEHYEHTQMFDSAKIGLHYLQDKCDRILFTPVDIPLFTAPTVTALVNSDAELACPVFNEKKGHPIMIASSLVDALCKDSGEGGLQGAISRCGIKMTLIPVDDQGILHDADTPEDYQQLLQYHNAQLIRPVVNLALAKEKPFFDHKIAMLLTLVDETQSVRTACQRMQISYSTGWNIIRSLESQLNYSLVERSQGGAKGGKSHLTDQGHRLLGLFRVFEHEARSSVNTIYEKYFGEEFCPKNAKAVNTIHGKECAE